MDLPSFDLLWQSSEKLSELESVLEEIDKKQIYKKSNERRRRFSRDSLYGVGFKAEDSDYYQPFKLCCGRAFYTPEEFSRHTDGHTKCTFETCTFVSDAKSMRVHREVVHEGGLFSKIFQQVTNKAVLEWREARKRNYPTLERAAAKRALLSERLSRGQIFKAKEYAPLKRHRPSVISERDFGLKAEISQSSHPLRKATDAECTTPHEAVTEPGIDGPQSIGSQLPLVSSAYDSDASDDDQPQRSKEQMDSDVIGQSLEDQQPEPCSPPPKKKSQSRRKRRPKWRGRKVSKPEENNECAAEPDQDLNSERKTPPPTDPFASHPVVQLRAQRKACLANPNRIHSRPTLLQMLLAEQVRTERNQLMQCVRYVVRENFFLNKPPSPTCDSRAILLAPDECTK
ncbi:unnamed protein product [Calicophoron daubneyi]|uniref:FMR1-interacting protein 1 conserved domain-containing protein n=1 Tax=Calicophoron daubneyi TaxID=300641 RepID=A0AAV2T2G8_CALDB